MAIKKSELYSSLWASCDELRGGMDASQYKDYVLVFLFLKYISDKYAGKPYAPIVIPPGASFEAMRALKGKKDIGDQINKAIIAPLVQANKQLSLSDFPDFNDPSKLGSGKEMADRLTNLIGIFENPKLNFAGNRAEGDDILGDAYEYLMRHFATESGKSKGQFYTPAEVSRIMAKVLGIAGARTSGETMVYDPTCGSGSLLLKVADEAGTPVSLFGQEKDSTTSGLARMNVILHNYPEAEIVQGNTLAGPKFLEGPGLRAFDYVVANPPFSDKRWSSGVNVEEDPYERFKHFGVPPAKQGDYAYLLHILASLKSTGKGACILPHGVLFRGHAEAAIRKNLIRKGYLKAIIGLPANLFYGTGIPACIVVVDKAEAQARKGIFMVDASQGFIKDGNKNRLRSRDIHRIVDAYRRGEAVKGYARNVSFEEIEKNDFNLNLPRYIDNRAAEDVQDIEAHLKGGIPQRDVDALDAYWEVCPDLRASLFKPLREGYVALNGEGRSTKDGGSDTADGFHLATLNLQLKEHPDLVCFTEKMEAHFASWQDRTATEIKQLAQGLDPKAVIEARSEALLAHYKGQPLIDPYAVYQHFMDYTAETLQDDLYLIALDGWVANPEPILETVKTGKKKGQQVEKGWACDLVPKPLIVARYFADEQAAIDAQQAELGALEAQRSELEEEHGGEDGAFSELDKINKAEVSKRLKELKIDNGEFKMAAEDAAKYSQPKTDKPETGELSESEILRQWLRLNKGEAALKKAIKDADAALDQQARDKYPELSEAEIKTLVVDDKWLATLEARIHGELDRIIQGLSQRVKELAERYERTLPQCAERVETLEAKVNAHLEKMGFAWK